MSMDSYDKALALINKLHAEKAALEFALFELKLEFENLMHSEFGTYANPTPWKSVREWQNAEKLIHADDVQP